MDPDMPQWDFVIEIAVSRKDVQVVAQAIGLARQYEIGRGIRLANAHEQPLPERWIEELIVHRHKLPGVERTRQKVHAIFGHIGSRLAEVFRLVQHTRADAAHFADIGLRKQPISVIAHYPYARG